MTDQFPGRRETDETPTGPDVAPEVETDDAASSVVESEDLDPGAGGDTDDSDDSDDLGSGAFDVPESGSSKASAEGGADAAGGEADDTKPHDTKPSKAYLGRPELTPLYAMAGLADLAAAVVRDIANEQIAAYRARRGKAEEPTGAASAEDLGEKAAEGAQEANAQFNAFLAKAQQRTQEIFEQAVAQYEHLADRGRVAVGDALDSAKQQRAKAEEKVSEGTQDGVDEFAAAAQKFADKVTALAQAAADKVTQATTATSPSSADAPAASEEASRAEAAAETGADLPTGGATAPTASTEVPPAAETDAESSAEGTRWDSNDGAGSAKQD